MRQIVQPAFPAPFKVLDAMFWAYSSPPRANVPVTMRWKKKLSLADIAKLVKTTVYNIRKLLMVER